MANVHVVTESLACLPYEADVNYAIRVVQHTVPGADGPLLLPTLLEQLHEDAALSISAATRPEPRDFEEVFREILGWGVDVVSIHPPADLGGCAEAARMALESIGEEARLSVVETRWAGPALGLIVLAAAVAGDEIPREAVADLVRAMDLLPRQVFVIPDMDHLARRGRTGRMRADVARRLDYALVCELRDGAPVVVERARPAADALRIAFERVGAGMGETGDVHVALASAGADAEAAALATVLSSRLFPTEIWIAPCDPALALEVGRGAYAVAAWEGSVMHFR